MTQSLDEVNRQVVCLVQACLGALSNNVLSVALLPSRKAPQIRISIERDSPVDREEADDIVAEFYALHDNDPEIGLDVVVEGSAPTIPEAPARLIYLRHKSDET
ncbi:hypothetical protein [Solimonas flava]|uniref:hypothetical protein n=1 Tax=Solimonas flava TaxID=415849 RepID=UPI0012B62B3B|nr:hypothetical protein [Solimonas flava]